MWLELEELFPQVVSQCDDNVQALLSREENRKRTIRYQRATPPVPATYVDVRLPEEYTTTTNNQQFLQYDNRNWIFILKCSAKASSASCT
jgi:nuclear transport factor 2 (NTF2) superfamily protein